MELDQTGGGIFLPNQLQNSEFTNDTFGENFDAEKFMTNATTLRHEDQIRYDREVMHVARVKLQIMGDLMAAGLSEPVGGLGVTISKWERAGNMTGAQQGMDPETEADKDRLTFDEVGIPMPITYKQFDLGFRFEEGAKRGGTPIRTDQIRIATEIVTETLEDTVIHGVPDLKVQGLDVPGLLNHPKVKKIAVSDGTKGQHWNTSSDPKIVQDMQKVIDQLRTMKKYGDFTVYVSGDIWTWLQGDYNISGQSLKTQYQRLIDIAQVKAIKPCHSFPDGTVICLQLEKSTIDLAIGKELGHFSWMINPMRTRFMVWACMVPRIKSDRDDNVGIVQLTAVA